MKKSTLKIAGRVVLGISCILTWALTCDLACDYFFKSDKSKIWEESQDVPTHSYVAGEWIYLNQLFMDYGVEIDYDKINEIKVADMSLSGEAGFYDSVTHNIYIDYSTGGSKDIFFTLAHEVAHSQGADHEYGHAIMNPWIMESTKSMEMDELIFNIIGMFYLLE